MIASLLFSAIVFVVDPNDSTLAFDGYKVERRGGDFVVTGARARSEIYARYDEPLWKDLNENETFVRNPAFATRFLNVSTTSRHGIKDYLAATGCNLVQLGRLYGVSFEETLPEVFAVLPEEEQERLRRAKLATQRSAALQVKELSDLDVPAYPLLYGCDAMKWNRTLCEAFLRVHPSAKAVNPPKSWEKGVLCPSDPATARLIEAFVFEVVSNADYEGVVATFWDDYGLNCHCDRCRANGNDRFGNQVAFAVGCYERACAKAKRKLIVRTWASGAAHWLGDEWVHAPGYGGPTGEPLSVWGKAYENLSSETMIQTKVYNADCQPNAPFSRLLGELNKVKPKNVELAEWQITGQTLGRQWLPASVVDDTAWRMKEARRRIGPNGGVALYAGGYKNRGYDALGDVMNSVNLYAWRELSWDPEKSMTTIYKEWSERTFGKVESHLIAALKASERAVVASFSPLGLGASTESNFAKNRARRESLLKYTNRYFLPEGEAALAPTRENIGRVLAEKDAALAAVDGMRSELQLADLPAKVKDEMLLRTEWLRTHLVVSRALDGALWRARYLETLAAADKEVGVVRQALAADFEAVRVHAGELFAGAVGRTFSFYAEPTQERQVTLGSPIGLVRDIRDQALGRDLQREIDALGASGGGTLTLTSGVYRTGALFFRPGVNLHLNAGAVIEGVDEADGYPMRETRIEGETCTYYPALINADRCDGFTISGAGVIDGHGANTWEEFWTKRAAARKGGGELRNKDLMRPRLLYVSNSKNVNVSGITFKNAKFWTTHYYNCEDVVVHNCRILADVMKDSRGQELKGPSTDAVDIDKCRRFTVRDCDIAVNDDGVVIKGGKGPWADDYGKHPENGPSTDILVENCTFRYPTHSALTLGSECPEADRITMRNCSVENINNLLYLKMRTDTPQHYANILVEDMTGRCNNILNTGAWAQYADLGGRTKEEVKSYAKNVTLRNINVEAKQHHVKKGEGEYFELENVTWSPDKTADERAVLQAQIEAASRAGGGKVVVAPGEHLLKGPLHLRSNVELHLEEGARLVFEDRPELYLPAVRSSWEGVECKTLSPLIYAYGCTNVAITGGGTIAPRMKTWRSWFGRGEGHRAATRQLYDWCSLQNAPPEERDVTALPDSKVRPHLMQFNRCKNVRLEGFKIRESPFWTIHLFLSEDCVLRNLDVYAHGHNNDGVDVEMTRNVLVENCTFDQGDDAIVIKSGRNQDAWRLNRPSENIEIRNCTVVNGHVLLGVGSEMSGGVRNVWMHDCTLTSDCLNLFYVKVNERRGGFVENIRMENCTAKNVKRAVMGVETDVLYQWKDFPTHEVRVTPIRNLSMKNVAVESAERLVNVRGDRRCPVKDVKLEHVSCAQVRKVNVVEHAENVQVLP